MELKLLTLIAAVLSTSLNTFISETEARNHVDSDSVSVADFIEKNLEYFGKEVRKEAFDKNFYPTSVDLRRTVYLPEDDTHAEYLDFDGDNGYFLVGDEYQLLDYAFAGQLEWFGYDREVFFSSDKSFCFKDDEGELNSFEVWKEYADEMGIDPSIIILPSKEEMETQDHKSVSKKITKKLANKRPGASVRSKHGTNIDGIQAGSNSIVNPDLYIKTYYGAKYKLSKTVYDDSFYYETSSDKSVYIVNDLYEGNCVLSAVHTYLQLLRDRWIMSALPSDNQVSYLYPYGEQIYTNAKKKGIDISVLSNQLPRLYSDVRDYYVDYQGYTYNGASLFDGVKAAKYVGRKYGYNKISGSTTNFYDTGDVRKLLNSGIPVPAGFDKAGPYEKHAILFTGYRQYKAKKKILWFTITDTKHIYTIYDSFRHSPSYFDLDKYAPPAKFISFFNSEIMKTGNFVRG